MSCKQTVPTVPAGVRLRANALLPYIAQCSGGRSEGRPVDPSICGRIWLFSYVFWQFPANSVGRGEGATGRAHQPGRQASSGTSSRSLRGRRPTCRCQGGSGPACIGDTEILNESESHWKREVGGIRNPGGWRSRGTPLNPGPRGPGFTPPPSSMVPCRC
jgi:hypothetical protein